MGRDRLCVRACVRVCVRVCLRVCVRARLVGGGEALALVDGGAAQVSVEEERVGGVRLG